MSEIAEKIAREHGIDWISGGSEGETIGCQCGARNKESSDSGMMSAHVRHVAEVAVAAVRAEIDESRPSPINGHEWRGQSDSGFSTICIHCGGWSGKVANSRCPATVTPSRDKVIRALHANDLRAAREWRAFADLPPEAVAWYGDEADVFFSLLPGRSEAEVKAEALRPVQLWAARFQPGDRWDPEDMRDLQAALGGIVESHPTSHEHRQEAEVKAEALREAAAVREVIANIHGDPSITPDMTLQSAESAYESWANSDSEAAWLRTRADLIERGEGRG